MDPSQPTIPETSPVPSPPAPKRSSRRGIVIVAVLVLLFSGIGYAASRIFDGPGATPTPTPAPAPALTSEERSRLSNATISASLLRVTELSAERAQLGVLAANTLQVNGDITVAGSGSFGGIVTAANFQGNGAGLTGVNAALLNGQPGSFYQNLSNLSGTVRGDQLPANVALTNAANTFTVANTFNNGLTVGGPFNATGAATLASLTLGTPLTIANGGTGLNSVASQGVLYGQGGGSLGVAVPAGAGLCLISGPTDVSWGVCGGGGAGVASVNGLTGALTIANATGSGSTITINDATTGAKGIASFNPANFTVTAGAVNTIQGIATTASPTFAGLTLSGALAANANVTLGDTTADLVTVNGIIQGGNPFVFEGSGADVNETTFTITNPTADQVITFPDATGTVCLTTGNCVGAGGGVTTAGGTTNAIPKFTGAQTLGDSLISDNGTTVSIGGALAVNTITPTSAFTVGATGQNLTLQGAAVSLTATSGGTTNSLTFATPAGIAKNITIPNASGTVAVSASGPLAIDANGNITCASCLTSGGGSGGVAAVDSLNGLTGILSLANATGSGSTITIDDAGTSTKGIASFNSTNFSVTGGAVNTIQNINTGATPTFAGINTNAITPAGAFTLGATGQSFTLQGNASSTITATGGGFTTAIGFTGVPTGAVTYNFDRAATAGTYTICTTASVCAGYAAASGSGNYIQNQSAAPQTANFYIQSAAAGSAAATIRGAVGQTANIFQVLNSSGTPLFQIDGDTNYATLSDNLTILGQGANADTTLTVRGNSSKGGFDLLADFQSYDGVTTETVARITNNGGIYLGNNTGQDGRIAISNGTSYGQIETALLTGAQVYQLPNASGTICISTGNCAGAGSTLQTSYTNSTTPEITLDTTRGALTVRDASSPLGANLFEVVSNGLGTTYLGVSATGINVTGAAVVSGNLTASTIIGAGTFQTADGTTSSGTTYRSGNTTAGVSGDVEIRSGNAIGGNSGSVTIDAGTSSGGTTGDVYVGTTNASSLVLGHAAADFYLQGASGSTGSTITASNGGFTTTVYFQNPTADVSYRFLAATTGTYDICTTAGNCNGAGVTLQSAYNASTTPELTLDATRGGLTIRDAAVPLGANLLEVRDNGLTTTYLGVTTSALTLGSNVDLIMQGATAYISNPQSQADSEAFGLGASVAGSNALAVGSGAATVANGVALGRNANVETAGGIAIGNGSNIEGFGGSVAIGLGAYAMDWSVAIGESAIQGASTQYAVLVGNSTQGVTGTLAAGYDAHADSAYSIALGNTTRASGFGAPIAIGSNASAINWSIAIGDQAEILAGSEDAVAIGTAAEAGSYSLSLGNQTVTGTRGLALGYQASTAGDNGSIALGLGASTTAANQMVIGGNTTSQGYINQVYLGSGVTDATPQNVVLQGTGGSGSNIAGASVTIAGGQGTGTGAGGNLNFQIATPGASGSTLNTLATVASFGGTNGSALFKNTVNSTQALNVQNASASNLFTVDTTNSRVGINLGGTNTPQLAAGVGGLNVHGAVRLSGAAGGSALFDTYTTPLGSTATDTRVNLGVSRPGNFGSVISLGLDDLADTNARGIAVFDNRANGNHRPSISVVSPDESQEFGFTWRGGNTAGYVTTANLTGSTASIVLQSGDVTSNPGTSGSVSVYSGNGFGANASSGNVNIDSGVASGTGTTGVINIGTNNASTLNIGRAGAPLALQGSTATITSNGAGNGISLITNSSTSTILAKSNTNSTAAFQIQNSLGTSMLNLDTVYPSTNEVTNGGFEASTTGWAAYIGTSNFGRNATDGAFGVASLSFDSNAVDEGVYYVKQLLPNTDYDFSFYSKNLTSPTSSFVMGYSEDGINETTHLSPGLSTRIAGWSRHTFSFQTGPTVSASAYIFIKTTSVTPRSWLIDGVVLSQNGGAYREAALAVGAVISTPIQVQTYDDDNESALVVYSNNGTQVFNVDTLSKTVSINTSSDVGRLNVQATGDVGIVVAQSSTGDLMRLTDNSGTSGHTDVLTVADEGAVTLKNRTDSAAAFRVLNAGSVPLFTIDTDNERVQIGSDTPDAIGALLILDSKTGADPTGIAGAMYYNSDLARMRCYIDSKWQFCNDPVGLIYGFNIEEEFMSFDQSTGRIGEYQWEESKAGTNAGITGIVPEANRPGIISLDTGTTTTGSNALWINSGGGTEPVIISGGETIEMAINVSALATGTDDFVLRLGLCDQIGSTDCTDGVYFEYDRSQSTNWRYATASNNTRTKNTSSKAVATGWTNLKIVANSASSVTFYVKNSGDTSYTTLGTIASNVPNTSARATQPEFSVYKTAGTNFRQVYIDYFQMRSSFTTAR